MHQFPLIREYKREVPSSTQSVDIDRLRVEIDRSKGSYERAIETQTDQLNEDTTRQQTRRSRTVEVAELQNTIVVTIPSSRKNKTKDNIIITLL